MIVLFSFLPIALSSLGVIGILFSIFSFLLIFWIEYKLVKECNYPGILALLLFIPIVNFIFLGVLAWGKKEIDHQQILRKDIFYYKSTFWIIFLIGTIILIVIGGIFALKNIEPNIEGDITFDTSSNEEAEGITTEGEFFATIEDCKKSECWETCSASKSCSFQDKKYVCTCK